MVCGEITYLMGVGFTVVWGSGFVTLGVCRVCGRMQVLTVSSQPTAGEGKAV